MKISKSGKICFTTLKKNSLAEKLKVVEYALQKAKSKHDSISLSFEQTSG